MESHGGGHGQFSSGCAFRDYPTHISVSQCTLAIPDHLARATSTKRPNGQHGHDLDGIAGENRKVRMPVEEPCGGLVRIRAHNRKSVHVIADIVNPLWLIFLVFLNGPPC
jgi:hypothetical protein